MEKKRKSIGGFTLLEKTRGIKANRRISEQD